VFFPLERLPSWVRAVAWFMPLHHAAELMRSLMTRGDPAAAIGHAVWLLAVAVLLLPAPLLLLRRRMVGG
jgi:ABC-type polysaccharide/polyol phosphate export permease